MSVISSKQQKVQATSKSGLSASFVAWARSIARSDKLKVVFGGHPATDGKTMYLPQLPMELTEDDLLMVRSDIMHESGHCTDTDFEYFTEFSKSMVRLLRAFSTRLRMFGSRRRERRNIRVLKL